MWILQLIKTPKHFFKESEYGMIDINIHGEGGKETPPQRWKATKQKSGH